jgi:hypothetical protein
MGTATQFDTSATTTVSCSWLLQVQVRNLLARTTKTSQKWLTKMDTALRLQWIQTIGVYGVDSSGCCHVGLEISIDWVTYNLRVLVVGDEVTIDQTVYVDDLAPEVINGIAVFNQAVNAECLGTKWQITYAAGVDVARIRRELGFVPAAPLQWVGKVEQQTFTVPELPELRVTFMQAIPQDAGKDKGLFDRIAEAFG